jgi:hypothetical protein
VRDVGIQFADEVTPVNVLWLWIDKQLPATAAATLSFTVWQSRDNQEWTEVKPAVVVPNAFSPRFEISIPTTSARYLKITTSPLNTAATLDPLYRDVFVTELQAFVSSQVSPPHGWQSATSGTASLSARTRILSDPGLTHDISLFLTGGDRAGGGSGGTWLLINGLTLTRRLASLLLLNARLARQDANQSRGHEGEWLYSASLGVSPFPALSSSLVYSGRSDTGPTGTTTTNTLALFSEAAPYRGISLLGFASYGISALANGQTSGLDALTLSATVQPNPALTVTGTFGHSGVLTTGAGLPRINLITNRVDLTATVNPVRALYLSGGISRQIPVGGIPVTLANGTVTFSPFRGGDLQLGVIFTETLDADASVTRLLAPSLRWNVGRATLTGSYNVLRTQSRTQPVDSNVFTADLRIPL